jgi:selenocysteine lyase/cysteine desulfurase
MVLAQTLRDGLSEIPGVVLYFADDLTNHISVHSFNLEGMEAGEVGNLIDVDHNIACRTGLHCAPLVHEQIGTTANHGAVRFSLGPFNTEEHFLAAINAVRDTAAFVNRK